MIPETFKKLTINNVEYDFADISNINNIDKIPYTYRILIENIIRQNLLNRNNNSKEQINSILKLTKYLIKKYKINSKFILGHSDIAPDRKQDPGEKFPWEFLSQNKIGIWHELKSKEIKVYRKLKLSNVLKIKFIKNLYKIGYPRNSKINKNKYNKNITVAFQRRFRQELIDGKIDKECFLISENLIKKLN